MAEWIVTLIAASTGTFGFIPQLLLTIRTRSTRDISLWAFIMCAVGLVFWLFLGLLYRNWIMLAYDVVNLVMCAAIIRLKLKYG